MEGMLIVISGPSGAGKGTIYSAVLEIMPSIATSISATTRSPRGKERDGVEYFFLSDSKFDELIRNDGLLEYADVFGHKYGTPKQKVLDVVNGGGTIMLEIDVRGARQIKEKFPQCVSIFIMPPSLEVLEKRLRGRATDDEKSIVRRLSEAKREIEDSFDFDYIVFNDELTKAIEEVVSIIRSEGRKVSRNKERIKNLLNQGENKNVN